MSQVAKSLTSVMEIALRNRVKQRRQAALQRERVFRDRNNPLDYMDDENLRRRYRFPREVILMLCTVLHDGLQRKTRTARALPVSLQILVALRFYATVTFLQLNSDFHGIHKATASRAILAVTRNLCEFAGQFIRFPRSAEEIAETVTNFARICGFPRVIGAVDGTQIPINRPSTADEHVIRVPQRVPCY